MAQFLRPSSDRTISGAWVNQSGASTNLYLSIDESVSSQADYIQTANNPGAESLYEAGLSVGDTPVAGDHVLRYVIGKDSSGGRAIEFIVRLFNNDNTEIATWTHSGLDTAITLSQTLTSGQIANINSYSGLYIRINPTTTGGGAARAGRVYWLELEIPDADETTPVNVSVGSNTFALEASLNSVSVATSMAVTVGIGLLSVLGSVFSVSAGVPGETIDPGLPYTLPFVLGGEESTDQNAFSSLNSLSSEIHIYAVNANALRNSTASLQLFDVSADINPLAANAVRNSSSVLNLFNADLAVFPAAVNSSSNQSTTIGLLGSVFEIHPVQSDSLQNVSVQLQNLNTDLSIIPVQVISFVNSSVETGILDVSVLIQAVQVSSSRNVSSQLEALSLSLSTYPVQSNSGTSVFALLNSTGISVSQLSVQVNTVRNSIAQAETLSVLSDILQANSIAVRNASASLGNINTDVDINAVSVSVIRNVIAETGIFETLTEIFPLNVSGQSNATVSLTFVPEISNEILSVQSSVAGNVSSVVEVIDLAFLINPVAVSSAENSLVQIGFLSTALDVFSTDVVTVRSSVVLLSSIDLSLSINQATVNIQGEETGTALLNTLNFNIQQRIVTVRTYYDQLPYTLPFILGGEDFRNILAEVNTLNILLDTHSVIALANGNTVAQAGNFGAILENFPVQIQTGSLAELGTLNINGRLLPVSINAGGSTSIPLEVQEVIVRTWNVEVFAIRNASVVLGQIGVNANIHSLSTQAENTISFFSVVTAIHSVNVAIADNEFVAGPAISMPLGFRVHIPRPIEIKMVSATYGQRNAIHFLERFKGMFTYVVESDTWYYLSEGTTNAHWKPWGTGGLNPLSAEQIRDLLQTLVGGARLDISAINNYVQGIQHAPANQKFHVSMNGGWVEFTPFSGNYNHLSNLPNLFSGDYNLLFNKPDIVGLPDGIVVYGSVLQNGNDLTYNTVWKWRMNQITYSSPVDKLLNFPASGTGHIRIDLVVGNTLGEIIRVPGTQVEIGESVTSPDVPANTIPLSEVTVLETGLLSFTNFALASFVRFDVNNQNLSPTQRLNARTNIQAVSKDTNDTRVGTLTNWGRVTVRGGGEGGDANHSFLQGDILYIRTAEDGTASSNMLDIRNGVHLGGMTMQKRGSVTIYAKGDSLTGYFILRLVGSNGVVRAEVNNSGIFANQRSAGSTYLTRRDELGKNYSQTITDAGILNDFSINAAVKLLKFTQADEITGIGLEEGDLIRIYASGKDVIIRNESELSAAGNRFSIGSDLTITDGAFATFMKVDSRIRREV